MTKKIMIIIILGILASLMSISYGLIGLFQYLILVHPFGDTLLAISLFNWIIALIISILFLVLGVLIFYNSITLTKSNYSKKSRCLIFIGLFFLTYSLYEFINAYFQSGLSLALSTLNISIIGILTIIIGFLWMSSDETKTKEFYFDNRKKFFKKIKVLSFLILLFLIANILFNVYKMSGIDYQESIEKLNLDGKIVFQETSSRNGIWKICMVDLSNPKEIDCFEKDGREPFWSPDGKDIFYWQWDEGYKDTVIYNTVDGTKRILDSDELYEENKKLRKLKTTKNPLNTVLDNAIISPDGKKTVYTYASSLYLLDNNSGEQIILMKSGYPESRNICNWPIWYSNNQILVECNLKMNNVLVRERYQRGFYLMDVGDSNLTLIVPSSKKSWLYYEHPDLYR